MFYLRWSSGFSLVHFISGLDVRAYCVTRSVTLQLPALNLVFSDTLVLFEAGERGLHHPAAGSPRAAE